MLAAFVAGAVWLRDIYQDEFLAFGALRLDPIRTWQALYAAGFAGFVMVLLGLRRRFVPARTIVAAAVLLRIPLLWCVPNSDVNRYAWEGRIQWLGFNPYSVAPDDPRLVEYRDDIWAGVNKKHYSTIYPPLAQLEFRGLAAAWYGVKAPQVLHALLDVAVVLALAATIRRRKMPSWPLALYAVNPLVLASFAHAGHCDTLMLLALVGFVAAADRRRWIAAGACLGAAILAKTVPVILLPLLVRRSRWGAATAVGVVVLGYLPFLDAGRGLFHALEDFPAQSRFNNVLDAVRGDWGTARVRNYGVAVVLAAAAAYRLARMRDWPADARWLLAAVVVLLPVVHFWYLSWVLAMAALRPARCWAWIVLSGTMALYWQAEWSARHGGPWRLDAASTWLIWGPFLATWLAEAGWSRVRDRRAARPSGG